MKAGPAHGRRAERTVVQHGNLVSPGEGGGDVRADKARAAGDEDSFPFQ